MQLVMPRIKLDCRRITRRILVNRRRSDVVAKERENQDSAISLQHVHAILRPLVLRREVVILGSAHDEKAVHRVE